MKSYWIPQSRATCLGSMIQEKPRELYFQEFRNSYGLFARCRVIFSDDPNKGGGTPCDERVIRCFLKLLFHTIAKRYRGPHRFVEPEGSYENILPIWTMIFLLYWRSKKRGLPLLQTPFF